MGLSTGEQEGVANLLISLFRNLSFSEVFTWGASIFANDIDESLLSLLCKRAALGGESPPLGFTIGLS